MSEWHQALAILIGLVVLMLFGGPKNNGGK